jgi:leucyl aminopeptidase (aminopeptidase T)
VGELGIGCLVGLKKLIGNLLQDEKFPGVHVAFGNPYPEKTKADWQCKSHIDVIPLRVTVKVNGKLLLKNGKFVDDIFH